MADGKDHYSDWALASGYFLFYLFPTSPTADKPKVARKKKKIPKTESLLSD
jgi:hypothetical protein